MLFYCKWDGDGAPASLLVDVESKVAAEKVAAHIGGAAPSSVAPVASNALVCEVVFDEGDDDVTLAPLGAFSGVLDSLECDGDVSGCGAEALDGDDNRVTCEREAEHRPPHRSGDLEW